MLVLITGANGHVGNNLCRALIERGYRVRASVRSLDDPAKVAPLGALPGLDLVELALNAKLFGIPRIMTPELVASSKGKRWCLSNARARAELGRVPRIPLETSLADMLGTLRALRAAEARRAAKVVEPCTAVAAARAKADGTAG